MSEKVTTLLGALPSSAGTLFLNARYAPNLPRDMTCQQFFYPFAKELEERGYTVTPEIPAGSFETVLLLGTKSILETEIFIREANARLKEGGMLLCGAGNKEGGTRLKKLCTESGFAVTEEISKNKMRIVRARKEDSSLPMSSRRKPGSRAFVGEDPGIRRDDVTLGGFTPQPICDGAFQSIPGLYGWDKIDTGSALLTRHLPGDLKGHIADFGCGYGYLSIYIAQKSNNITKLDLYDADYRALIAAKCNLDQKIEVFWQDLRDFDVKRPLYDTIIMNPPFHQDKKTDFEIGQNFIQSASRALKSNGSAYIVANSHLPYERVLAQEFGFFDKLAEEQGFKVYRATV